MVAVRVGGELGISSSMTQGSRGQGVGDPGYVGAGDWGRKTVNMYEMISILGIVQRPMQD